MRSIPRLKKLYRQFNYRYFNDSLPDDAIVRWATDEERAKKEVMKGLDGVAYCDYETDNGRALILLDKQDLAKRDKWMEMTLLHEMNHLYCDDERGIHGMGFEAGMLRLANMGAFKGRW